MDNNETNSDIKTIEIQNDISLNTETNQTSEINSQQNITDQKKLETENQKNLQNVAVVDQSNEKFINNIQQSTENNSSKPETKANYLLIFIIFIVIFGAIIFLFPIIDKYI